MSDSQNVGFGFTVSTGADASVFGVNQLPDVFGIVKGKLQLAANDSSFIAQVFGDKANTSEVQSIIGEWKIGVFGQLPSVQVISAADMNGADGAYASSTQKIYLSDSLFQSGAAPVNSVFGAAGVLVEETFHWLDSRVGTDTQGDEGELAKNLLFDVKLSDSELSLIKAESDRGFVLVDGLDIEVEQSSTLEIGRNENGRMEIFAIGKDSQGQLDNKLYQRYQTIADGSWSDWMWTGRVGKEVEVAQNVDGSMEIFLIGTDNKVWHGSQKAPNSSIGDWKDFGMSAIDIEVGKNASGRLEVFAVNANGDIYNRYQNSPRNYSQTTWSNVFRMAGDVKAMELEVASNQDGRIELFAIGLDGKLSHRFQLGKDQSFSGWYYMDIVVKDLEIGKNQDGRLEIFAIRNDGRLVNNWQVAPSSSWRKTSSSSSPLNWSDLGINVSEIEVAINADQRQELFAIRSGDNQVMRRYQTGHNQGLNPNGWLDTELKAVEIETGINKSGRMEVVAFDNLGATRHQFQQNPSNSLNWNGTWQFMGDRFNASFNFKGVDSVAISGLMATSNNLTQLINGQLIGQYKDVDGLVGAYNHCWDFVAYATGIDKSSKYWLTTNWKAGANVMSNGNVAVGTAIATFAGQNGKYNGGAYQHTAIFAGYDTVKGVSGFWVWDQNFDALLNGDRSIKKHFVRNNSSQSSDADNYFVINV